MLIIGLILCGAIVLVTFWPQIRAGDAERRGVDPRAREELDALKRIHRKGGPVRW